MIIERVERHKPNWGPWDYATISQQPLFSRERWGQTVHWNVLKDQAEKIRVITCLIRDVPDLSSLTPQYMEILKANLLIFDDMFYYLIGEFLGDDTYTAASTPRLLRILERVQFWNIDRYSDIQEINSILNRAYESFEEVSTRDCYRDLFSVVYRDPNSLLSVGMNGKFTGYSFFDLAVEYAHSFYQQKKYDKAFIALYKFNLRYLYSFHGAFETIAGLIRHIDFPALLQEFRLSENAKEKVADWQSKIKDTRENLISNLRDYPEYQPWVDRYLGVSDKEFIVDELFPDVNMDDGDNIEKICSTEMWINLLEVANLLKENELFLPMINALKPFFKDDENVTVKFLRDIENKEDMEVVAIINRYINERLTTPVFKQKDFYNALKSNSLYLSSYSNFNNQIKLPRR